MIPTARRKRGDASAMSAYSMWPARGQTHFQAAGDAAARRDESSPLKQRKRSVSPRNSEDSHRSAGQGIWGAAGKSGGGVKDGIVACVRCVPEKGLSLSRIEVKGGPGAAAPPCRRTSRPEATSTRPGGPPPGSVCPSAGASEGAKRSECAAAGGAQTAKAPGARLGNPPAPPRPPSPRPGYARWPPRAASPPAPPAGSPPRRPTP